MRSGEYATLKSLPHTKPECFSKIGTQISSVTPGHTVDSKTTMLPGLIYLPTKALAPSTGVKSGVQSELTGVGTATTINLASFKQLGSEVNCTVVSFTPSSPISSVGSIPCLYKLIFSSLISKPIVGICLANATANGKPTYPKPTTATGPFKYFSFSIKTSPLVKVLKLI